MSASSSSDRSHQPVRYSRHSSVDISNPETLCYTLGKTLGSGTYAKVKAAWSPHEKSVIAIKIVNKLVASHDYRTKFLPREIGILRRVRHPSILLVHRIIETDKRVYFMLELAENGDLLDYINHRRYLPEPEARFVTRQLSAGIAHCHSLDIVHRDLKCENIMLTKDMSVKIGDFGFSRTVTNQDVKTPCGSYSYAAPELFISRGSCYDGKKADIWSLGVMLYAMVCGRLPFGDDSQVKVLQQRPLHFKRILTSECRDLLVYGMLNRSPVHRCDIIQLRISPWMRGTIETLRPYAQLKYRLEDCLPRDFLTSKAPHASPAHGSPPMFPHMKLPVTYESPSKRHDSLNSQGPSYAGHNQEIEKLVTGRNHGKQSAATAHANLKHKGLKTRLGAAGKKIAHAVFHVSHTHHNNGHTSGKPSGHT